MLMLAAGDASTNTSICSCMSEINRIDKDMFCMMQILSRAPKLEYFRMGSSRVGSDGGIALARSMMTGDICSHC